MIAFSHWMVAGITAILIGSIVVSAMTYQEALKSRIAIAEMRGVVAVKTEDLAAIKVLIETNRKFHEANRVEIAKIRATLEKK